MSCQNKIICFIPLYVFYRDINAVYKSSKSPDQGSFILNYMYTLNISY